MTTRFTNLIFVGVLVIFCVALSTKEVFGQPPGIPNCNNPDNESYSEPLEPSRTLAVKKAVIKKNLLRITPVDDNRFSIFLRKVEIAEPDEALKGTFIAVYEDSCGGFYRAVIFNRTKELSDEWRDKIEKVLAPRDVSLEQGR